MDYMGITHSVCPVCRQVVPAKVLSSGDGVWFRKHCPQHGESMVRVCGNPTDYLQAQRYVKPAWIPEGFSGDAGGNCPDGCGFCDRHEQHLCMPIIEITECCDLACPICLNRSGEQQATADLTLPELERMLDELIRCEPQIDVLNLSGGEPLLHPQLLDLIDACLARKQIIRVSVSTNGLQLLRQPELLTELNRRAVVISLQLDGFDDAANTLLRGRPLRQEKEAILRLLQSLDMTTSLTMTVAGGINEAEVSSVLRLLFDEPHIISLMLQPLAFIGRGQNLAGQIQRLGGGDLIRILNQAGVPPVCAEDFVPLPCSHPLCFRLGYYLMLEEGKPIALNRLTGASTLLDSVANRVVFGLDRSEHERLKELIYELWSGPAGAVPESKSVLRTLKNILKDLPKAMDCCCFDPRKAFRLGERKIKSIFIHSFQDADTFDLARVRRCCQAYPQRDGMLLPACVRNVRPRGNA